MVVTRFVSQTASQNESTEANVCSQELLGREPLHHARAYNIIQFIFSQYYLSVSMAFIQNACLKLFV